MKKLLVLTGLIVLLAGGLVAYAQTTPPARTVPTAPLVTSLGNTDDVRIVKGGAASAGDVFASLLQLQAWVFGGDSQRTGVTAPALTSCGTGSPAISGNDFAGTVTIGTTATGCVITFNTAYAVAPTCVVSSRTAPGTTTPAYTVSTTALTLTQASGSGNLWDYICVAKKGS